MDKEKENKKFAHGRTHKEMKDLQHKQIGKDLKEISPSNGGDKIQDKDFKNRYSDYKVKEGDENHYHVIQETRLFDQSTGQKKSTPSVQMYTEAQMKRLLENDGFRGYTTHILHKPSGGTISEKDVNKDQSHQDASLATQDPGAITITGDKADEYRAFLAAKDKAGDGNDENNSGNPPAPESPDPSSLRTVDEGRAMYLDVFGEEAGEDALLKDMKADIQKELDSLKE